MKIQICGILGWEVPEASKWVQTAYFLCYQQKTGRGMALSVLQLCATDNSKRKHLRVYVSHLTDDVSQCRELDQGAGSRGVKIVDQAKKSHFLL